MPIQQTKKQSDLEKRLQLLRRQVYGKVEEKKSEVRNEKLDNEVGGRKSHFTIPHPTSHIPHPISNSASFRTDLTYLRHDLLKILIFASIAIGAQIVLFILSQNRILNLNFL